MRAHYRFCFIFVCVLLFLDISSSATVVYRTQQAALHARQKLHGFEYPPGERLIVKLSSELKNFPLLEGPTSNLFDNATSGGSTFCSVNLPPIQPLSKEVNCAQRCFIVCSPHTLPVHVLKQVFCRFGNLIDVYLLNNRNCGYVKYATTESAKQVTDWFRSLKCVKNTNQISYLLSGDEHFAWCRNLWRSIESTRGRGANRTKEALEKWWLIDRHHHKTNNNTKKLLFVYIRRFFSFNSI